MPIWCAMLLLGSCVHDTFVGQCVQMLWLAFHLRKQLPPLCETCSVSCVQPSNSLCVGVLPVTGESDGSWAVDLPAEEVPAELPEPCLGINFARNGMQQRDWLALVAVHSDAWLLSVAFYYGGAACMPCRVHAAIPATRAAGL